MLAINTDFHGTSRNSVDIRGTLRRIAEAGFSHVHWCHEWSGSYLYSIHEMLQIKEWCDEFGLSVKGLHAPEGERDVDAKVYNSRNECSRVSGVELLKNRVDLAHVLNAEAIVIHWRLPWQMIPTEEDFRENYLKPAFRSFDELEPYCKTRKVKICIENTGGPPSYCCPVYDTLYRRYDRDFMGFCLDTGHANIHCKEKCYEYAEHYGDRLFMIHVHDNHGENDEHILPYEGNYDWEGFAGALARSAYQLPIVMEPGFGKAPGDDTAWLKRAFEVGNRLSAMVEKHRNA